MTALSALRFRGTFRDYQQTVLDRADTHLRDRHLHIVAAPGSGKTTLGLELVCRLGSPALLLSPTVTIRQQWIDRFGESFLPESASVSDYASFDLRSPALLTSVTYQALFSAYTGASARIPAGEDAEDDDAGSDEETALDYSGFDLLSALQKAGIRTVCLDEAHHLHSEWHRALTDVLAKLGPEITVIALTATPPYDCSPAEWQKYLDLCGEIDEEIFVPQLVAQKTLCPHQDYIYFTYPTPEEQECLKAYREKACLAVSRILHGGTLKAALEHAGLYRATPPEEEILADKDAYLALFSLASEAGSPVAGSALRLISRDGSVEPFSLALAECGLNFLRAHPARFGESACESVRSICAGYGLTERGKICLQITDKLNRMLLASTGKLDAIRAIVGSESASLGTSLRMLILTDYIRKEQVRIIGTDEPIPNMGAVPVFESLRRVFGASRKLALLTGTLVILRQTELDAIRKIADRDSVTCTVAPIGVTGYAEVRFAGSNKNKVAILTEAFEHGLIEVLIGTKSLLGEGWDSPSINSLILASFVGSFMLSNQMRGRAIRTVRNDPDKTASIWHLVTAEPEFLSEEPEPDLNRIRGNDYLSVKRRFSGFLAPAYSRDSIESGTDRLDCLKPPFDEDGYRRINEEMLRASADRKSLSDRWKESLRGSTHPEILDVCEVPKELIPKRYIAGNLIRILLLSGIAALLIFTGLTSKGETFFSLPAGSLTVAAAAAALVFSIRPLIRLIKQGTPAGMLRCFCGAMNRAMRKCGLLENPKASFRVWKDRYTGHFYCSLTGKDTGARDKKVFSAALGELFSPIEDPRYVLIRLSAAGSRRCFAQSYSCPAVLGKSKESAQIFSAELKKAVCPFEAVYTKNDTGATLLRYARKHADSRFCAPTSGKRVALPGAR